MVGLLTVMSSSYCVVHLPIDSTLHHFGRADLYSHYRLSRYKFVFGF
jgi:hypothetical protein